MISLALDADSGALPVDHAKTTLLHTPSVHTLLFDPPGSFRLLILFHITNLIRTRPDDVLSSC